MEVTDEIGYLRGLVKKFLEALPAIICVCGLSHHLSSSRSLAIVTEW